MIYFAKNAPGPQLGKIRADLTGGITTYQPWTGVPASYSTFRDIFVSQTDMTITGTDGIGGCVSAGTKDAVTRNWRYASATGFEYGVTRDNAGNVYYIDQTFPGGGACRKLSSTGVFLTGYGTNGSGVNQLAGGVAQAITNSSILYIADGANYRVVKRNCSDLSTAGSINVGSATFSNCYGVTLLKDGSIIVYISEVGGTQKVGLRKYSAAGVLLAENAPGGGGGAGVNQWGANVGVRLTTDGTYVWGVDTTNNRIKRHLVSDLSYVDHVVTGLADMTGLSSDEWWAYMYGDVNVSQSFASGRGRPRRFLKSFNPADII